MQQDVCGAVSKLSVGEIQGTRDEEQIQPFARFEIIRVRLGFRSYCGC